LGITFLIQSTKTVQTTVVSTDAEIVKKNERFRKPQD